MKISFVSNSSRRLAKLLLLSVAGAADWFQNPWKAKIENAIRRDVGKTGEEGVRSAVKCQRCAVAAMLSYCSTKSCSVLGVFQQTEQNCQNGTLHVSAVTQRSTLPKTRSASALVSHGNACFWLACGKIAESPSSIWEIEGLLPSSCWRPSSVWLWDWLYPCGEGEKKQNKKKNSPLRHVNRVHLLAQLLVPNRKPQQNSELCLDNGDVQQLDELPFDRWPRQNTSALLSAKKMIFLLAFVSCKEYYNKKKKIILWIIFFFVSKCFPAIMLEIWEHKCTPLPVVLE